jgi:hypothetical protein
LPDIFQEFSVAPNGKAGVSLNWKVAQESNEKVYFIEHSNDGNKWTDLGVVRSAGISGEPVKYVYFHASAEPGIHYYRIRQTDPNGNKNYSPVKKVRLNESLQIAMWPNPVKDMLSVSIPALSGNTGYNATLYDHQGRLLISMPLHGGINTINIRSLAPGSYVILVRDSYSTQSEKFVKR